MKLTSYQKLRRKHDRLHSAIWDLKKDLGLVMCGNEEAPVIGPDGMRAPLRMYGFGQSGMTRDEIIKRVGKL